MRVSGDGDFLMGRLTKPPNFAWRPLFDYCCKSSKSGNFSTKNVRRSDLQIGIGTCFPASITTATARDIFLHLRLLKDVCRYGHGRQAAYSADRKWRSRTRSCMETRSIPLSRGNLYRPRFINVQMTLANINRQWRHRYREKGEKRRHWSYRV